MGVETVRALRTLLIGRAATTGVSQHSSFLFPVPSMLYGFARVLDLGAQLDSYNVSTTPAHADSLALAYDWMAASREINDATIANITEYLEEYFKSENGQALLRKAREELKKRSRDAPQAVR